MRVVTVAARFPDPTEPFVVDEVCAMADRGVEAVVVADKLALRGDPVTRARLGDRVKVRAPELVSVVVPARNEAIDLPGQLQALSEQTYAGAWELLICDNGSTDSTQAVARSWQSKLPHLRIIDASGRRGINYTRNVGIANAKGDFIAFVDADDVASPGWLAALVEAAPAVDIVSGSLDELATHGQHEIPDSLEMKLDFMPSFPGGNCGVWASIARELTFDEEYRFGGSDIEYSWRAQLAGYRIGYTTDALVSVRRPTRLREVARQWYGYGSSEPLLYRRFRDLGMPRSRYDVARRQWGWIVRNIGDAFRGGERRDRWVRRVAYRTGRITGSVMQRVIFL
jgi:glycosyltransferase involved in cell wall biosynthesis